MTSYSCRGCGRELGIMPRARCGGCSEGVDVESVVSHTADCPDPWLRYWRLPLRGALVATCRGCGASAPADLPPGAGR